ncbi:MAG: ABC transporter ATP-binding protein [Candidatus Woesearchaeota archaeon]
MNRIKKVWMKATSPFRTIRGKPLSAKKVRFSYDKNEILKDLSLNVKTSQIVAIVGKSGSGKSTFLNLVSGAITSPYKGDIKVLGNTKDFAKEDIGYVPQELSIIPNMTIEENFIFFGYLNGLEKSKSMQAGQNLMNTLQLNVPVTRYPDELSGGQKVRLNIIVSLLHNPKVVILDEPFVGLDYYNRKLLWHFLEHLKNRRKTILLTTHMLSETEHFADKIVILNYGKIFAKGKLREIKAKLKTYYILEIKFRQLSKKQLEGIKKYSRSHSITILDMFKNYMMFSITTVGQKNYFLKHLDKINVDYLEKGFREPNLDELFLKVRSV